MKKVNSRDMHYEADPLFARRWSPRAMSGEPITLQELMRLFEAARWAPSSSNSQPWRFVYALRDDGHWQQFLALLTDSNQRWAKRAGALIVVASSELSENSGRPSRTHASQELHGKISHCRAL